VSLLKMNRRKLKLWNAQARAVGHHNNDWHVVTWGLVETGSEWDGVHINIVWRRIRQNCASNRAANDLTRAVWENRVHALREQRRNGRDKLDGALASVPAWELEPEPSYFEDMEE
jgi:hypothetical protein